LLLQVLYTVRSERMLMEQLEYNLLFRWFVGLNMDETVWVPTVVKGGVKVSHQGGAKGDHLFLT
jgi:transposase